jgi:hypothetical protein
MTRGFPSRPVLSAALVLLLIASFSLTAFVAPTSAEPSQETASNSVSLTNSITIPADEGPGPRFPFSVLDQATTTITKTICPSTATCAGGGTTTTLVPGSQVQFLVVVANNQGPATFIDQWQAGLVFQGGDGCGAAGPPSSPGFVGQVTCTSNSAVLNFLVSPTATTPSTATNQASIGGATPSTVTVNIAAPTATPTITSTPTRTATPTTGVPATPVVSGTPGVGCTTVIGGTCAVVGAAAGSCTKTGSGTCSVTATGPTNATVGGVPILFVPTTVNPNGEQITCTATSATFTTSCTGTTLGDPICGGTVTVAFPLVGGGFGNVTGTISCAGTGTLIVCKQIQILGSGALGGIGGIGGIGGFGGLNPPGPLGGIGFNPLGPVGGPNFGGIGGVGGIGGIGGVGGLGLQGSTVTFTTPPGGPVIPSITIPVGQLGPICAAGVVANVGTVAVTEVVPAGFTLNSVTGGTLSGNTGTATITAGTTTTLTFINAPINVNIPNVLPILPPPPLQFIPPPPPPLLPPPPPAPAAGARAPAAFPEVPVIPEADSLFLVVGGLVALGGLVGLRSLRRRRDDEV